MIRAGNHPADRHAVAGMAVRHQGYVMKDMRMAREITRLTHRFVIHVPAPG